MLDWVHRTVATTGVCAIAPMGCKPGGTKCAPGGSKGCTAGLRWVWGPCVCTARAFPEGAQVPVRPFLPSVFVSQCQGPTAFQSTRPLCLLASVTVTVVLEYVSFKLRVSVAAYFPQRPCCSVSGPGCSPGTPVCFSWENSPSLRGCLCHSRTLSVLLCW